MELITQPQLLAEWISQPWHWAVSGASLALILFLMTWMGHKFGISTSYEVICSAAGAGKKIPFFQRDLKADSWLIMFALGTIIGGVISGIFLKSDAPVAISASTIEHLSTLGISYPESDAKGLGFIPTEIFNFNNWRGIALAIFGGFLVGFGARYGKGCTSGHAITGLSHLQLPSLITVIGFFLGGLLMTHLFLPFLIQ